MEKQEDQVELAEGVFRVFNHTVQRNASGIFVVTGIVGHDTHSGGVGVGPVWIPKIGAVFHTRDLGELKGWLIERELERLRWSKLDGEADAVMLELAMTVPYTQKCTCQAYPTHQAEDCHEHNDNPRHFVGDYEFPCNCPPEALEQAA